MAEPGAEPGAELGAELGTDEFTPAFAAALRTLFILRRDVRHFRRDPLPGGMITRLLGVACLAPSVGFSQPWRFVIVEDPARRAAVRANFLACNLEAQRQYAGDRAARYARLKLAGLDDAPCQIAVFAEADPATGHGLGRQTMGETVAYSVVMAIHTLWLALRAEGVGLGWVSILDPAAITAALDVPAGWRFIGYLCIGYPQETHASPELEREGWEQRVSHEAVILRR
ncbi:5,6-dimethylbenzimidazole synthase [Acidiphilium sp.]|uniref:5,6-dimethylbenzimidazole synthase n=1 Tax=Acidiphilium sp. TaxID=527 RepID=UPI003CFBCF53